MKTDIVILSKTQELLARALASICKYVKSSRIGKVIVGWTGEDKPAEQDIDLLGNSLTVESLDCYNFAANNNYLVSKHCMSDAVLFMNDDVELVSDSVTRCLECLESDRRSKIGTVGIKLLYPDRTIQHAGQQIFLDADGKFSGCGHLDFKKPDFKMADRVVIGNTGAFMMLRREDFLNVGGFNEMYKNCFEDLELNLKLMSFAKHNCCLASNWAWHVESATRKQASCTLDYKLLESYVNKRQWIVGMYAI